MLWFKQKRTSWKSATCWQDYALNWTFFSSLYSEGLRVSCNTVYNVCTFTISGWYFGKTGGLLGIYDNEPSNDWMTSDRQIVNSLEDFVNSWSVTHDRQCPVRFFSNSPAQPTLEEAQACQSVFASTDSALMPCYSTIDPAPYMTMCLRDMHTMKNRADKQAGVCSSAAAYIKQCQQVSTENSIFSSNRS